MKRSSGFSTIEILIAATLFSMIVGYTMPLMVRSIRDVARHGWTYAHTDAALLAAVRLQEEVNGAMVVTLLSATEIEIRPSDPHLLIKKIRWEKGVIRIHRASYIYPITAVGDAKSVHFTKDVPHQITMHWDNNAFPLVIP